MKVEVAFLVKISIGLIALILILANSNTAQADGACCLDNGSCLDLPSPLACLLADGQWMGEGTYCVEVQCIGACCLPDGSCLDSLSWNACQDSGGKYQGHGTICDTIVCPIPIPTLTNWGLLVLLVLLVISGIIVIRHRRRGVARAKTCCQPCDVGNHG